MKQEDYPDILYVDDNTLLNSATEFNYTQRYICEDLAPQWHKFPNEKPPLALGNISNELLVARRVTTDEGSFVEYDVAIYDVVNSFFMRGQNITKSVIAWKEINEFIED